MREILFRGRMLTGEWVYGDLRNDIKGSTKYWDTCSQRICWECSNAPVENGTVGQYTGLKDKNGTKIFEGDLMMWTSTDTDGSLITQIDEVKWSKYGWICGKEMQFLAYYLLFDPSYENLELIGNIHDNPELVKEKLK